MPTLRHIMVAAFFALYALVGGVIFDDYGLAYDEPSIRYVGALNWDYVLHGDPALFTYKDRYYGPFFEMLLVGLERLFQVTDARAIYLLRHFVTFALFYGSVVSFYRLGMRRFGDWRIGLLGSVFLVISPRIFAHAFYNSKDLAFLAVFILAVATFVRALEQPTFGRVACHALLSAMLADIRIIGLLIPALTVSAFAGEACWAATLPRRTAVRNLIAYTILFTLLLIGFFPFLWGNPWARLIETIRAMSQFPWNADILYLGRYVNATELPWHYLPVWIAISTPLLYLGLWLVGSAVIGATFARTPTEMWRATHMRQDVIWLVWLGAPLAAVFLFHSVVYDEWRHLFFVYPAILLIALRGVVWLRQRLARIARPRLRRWVQGCGAGVLLLGVAEPLTWMIRWHPYQNLYFNRLAGADLQAAKQRFELDYWGLAYTEALRYLATHDAAPQIRVVIDRFPRKFCAAMLPAAERARVTCISDFAAAQYFVGNYRLNKDGYPCAGEVYAVEVAGAKVAVVHETKHCRTQ